jgi:phage shock protein PspC (stress-responsive transcriptional regulator)
MKTLAKIQQDKWLGGVCSGFAYMLGVPTWLVRMGWTLAVFLTCGVPLLAYLLLWVFMPRWHIDPSDYAVRTQRIYEDGPSRATPSAPAAAATPAPPAAAAPAELQPPQPPQS